MSFNSTVGHSGGASSLLAAPPCTAWRCGSCTKPSAALSALRIGLMFQDERDHHDPGPSGTGKSVLIKHLVGLAGARLG